MKKVFMRHKNDCYTACLATVLGLPYEQVPRFFDDEDNVVGEWTETVNSFLEGYGLQVVTVKGDLDFIKQLKGLLIVAGLSYTPEYREKDQFHAVIYRDGELYHDPKPDPTGVIVPEVVDLLVRINRDNVQCRQQGYCPTHDPEDYINSLTCKDCDHAEGA